MRKITNYRLFTNSFLQSDKCKYGDLYGLTYLTDFKIPVHNNHQIIPNYNDNTNRSINLYIAGDSYLGPDFIQNKYVFKGVKKINYYKLNSGDTSRFILNLKENNVLVIESVERFVRLCRDSNYLIDQIPINKREIIHKVFSIKKIDNSISKYLYNKNINQNLEFNLFDYRIFNRIKEIKADFNYHYFNRINKDVYLSPDKKYLLLSSTVDSLSLYSSFAEISDDEIRMIVNSINHTYTYFKSIGFKEVYFSFIPNPVSILYPNIGKYNHLIEKVQLNKNLHAPILDVYTIFRYTNQNIYYRSDTHWNINGFKLWLEIFNRNILNVNINNNAK